MIALVAGIAVASGPERIPGEVKQALDLRGSWEGTWQAISRSAGPSNCKAQLKPGSLQAIDAGVGGARWEGHCRFVDEGSGKCRLTWFGDWPGISKWEGGRVIICLGTPDIKQRPRSGKRNRNA